MSIRAIWIAALAVGFAGGLDGCAIAPAPSCPAARAMLSPSSSPSALIAAPPGVPPSAAAPANAVPPEAASRKSAAPPKPTPSYTPSGVERDNTARRVGPERFSGGSTPPPTGRAAPRRGNHRQTGGRHRYQDLEDEQSEPAINPPLDAGE
jgi:hypothetical protein